MMMQNAGTTLIPIVSFEDALQQHRQVDPARLRFRFNATMYDSVKDTVPKADRGAVCRVCHSPNGTPGFVRFDWPMGHPLFGKPIPCPACNNGQRQ